MIIYVQTECNDIWSLRDFLKSEGETEGVTIIDRLFNDFTEDTIEEYFDELWGDDTNWAYTIADYLVEHEYEIREELAEREEEDHD